MANCQVVLTIRYKHFAQDSASPGGSVSIRLRIRIHTFSTNQKINTFVCCCKKKTQCPLVRKITKEVPPQYVPQLQLSMEVMDLDVCHFVQYRPTMGAFDPWQMEVTIVQRDRMWFARNLPLFQKFISDLESVKSLGSITDEPPPKIQRPLREKKRKIDTFLVQDENEIKNENIHKSVLEIID